MDAVVLHRFQLSRTAALGLVLVASLAACSSGGKKARNSATTATKASSIKTIELQLGSIDVESAGPPVSLDGATRDSVLAATNKYVDTAVYSPLTKGTLGAGYEALFDSGVRTAATGADARALTDTQVGKVTTFTVSSPKLAVSALADNSGAVLYVATRGRLNIKAVTDAGPLTITRSFELTFAPAGPKQWTVTAYRVLTARTTPKGVTTTTAASAGGKP